MCTGPVIWNLTEQTVCAITVTWSFHVQYVLESLVKVKRSSKSIRVETKVGCYVWVSVGEPARNTNCQERHSFFKLALFTGSQLLKITTPLPCTYLWYKLLAVYTTRTAVLTAYKVIVQSINLSGRPAGRGGRVATVGQLLFAPWAWADSTLHPSILSGSVNEYRHGRQSTSDRGTRPPKKFALANRNELRVSDSYALLFLLLATYIRD